VISFTDITERKRNERALAASERKTRRILETLRGLLADRNNAVTVEVNDAMCLILGGRGTDHRPRHLRLHG